MLYFGGVWRVPGYGVDVICKTDCKPKWFRRYGIKVSQKVLDELMSKNVCGWCACGGNYHVKHIKLYDLAAIVDYLRSNGYEKER